MTIRCLMFVFVTVLFSCKKSGYDTVSVPVEEQPLPAHTLTLKSQRVNTAIGGYLLATPALYSEGKDSHPLIIFLHGDGQMGNGNNDLELLLADGIGKLLAEKRFPAEIQFGSSKYSFIVLSPQYSRHPTTEQVGAFIQFAKTEFRVDSTRVYISGLSSGGIAATEVAAKFPSMIAAVVPIAGVMNSGDLEGKCKAIAATNMPLWTFHNSSDPMIPPGDAVRFNDLIKKYFPSVPPRLTILNESGHDAWSVALDPIYKEDSKNIYEWMLQYSRN